MSKTTIKTSAKQKRGRGRDSQPRPRPRLNSQPQGATKHLRPSQSQYLQCFSVGRVPQNFFLLSPEGPKIEKFQDRPPVIDLLMGLFRGAVFRHGGGARKQPIKQQTEMPTSTMALMGRFPSLMGRFPTLVGRFPDYVLRGRFTSWKSTGKQPIKKRGIKRFLIRDWNFQARLKISSVPPTKPLFFVGNAGGRDWKFEARLKISSEIEFFSIFGPLGSPGFFSVGGLSNSRTCGVGVGVRIGLLCFLGIFEGFFCLI